MAGLYTSELQHNDYGRQLAVQEEAGSKMTYGIRLQHPELPSAMGETFVDTDIDIMLKCFR
ncbi:hypothetical protein BK147_29095 [Paenibacillus sp. FSL R7-0337]|nr:hypothetical protein C162_05799 [Paenibacillus sp. FSL R7-269]OMF87038.1 hypothetical protein BK147_29095 [Paenibacillus sp. FSL R7-0337]